MVRRSCRNNRRSYVVGGKSSAVSLPELRGISWIVVDLQKKTYVAWEALEAHLRLPEYKKRTVVDQTHDGTSSG